jgi:hypothetical protein
MRISDNDLVFLQKKNRKNEQNTQIINPSLPFSVTVPGSYVLGTSMRYNVKKTGKLFFTNAFMIETTPHPSLLVI